MDYLSVRMDPAAVVTGSAMASKADIFANLAEKAADCYGVDRHAVEKALQAREALGSTGFGAAVAIPHARIKGLDQCVGMFLRLAEPIPFDAHDGQAVDIIFGLLSPDQASADHLKALAEVSRFLRDDAVLAKLRGAAGEDALYVLLTGQQGQQAA